MILVTESVTTDAELQAILDRLSGLGMSAQVLRIGTRPLVHVTSGHTRRARALLTHDRVRALIPTSGPRVRREGRRFYPYHALRTGAGGLLLLGLLVALAGFLARGVGAAPVPGVPLPPAEWPWYAAPLRGLLGLFRGSPAWLGPTTALILALLVVALPFVDRSRGEGLRARAPFLVIGLAFVLGIVALGVKGLS